MRAWKAAGVATIALILTACGAGNAADGDDVAGPAAGEEVDGAATDGGGEVDGAATDAASDADDTDDADDADDAGEADDADGGAAGGGDPAAYGLDDDVTVLGIGETGLVEWDSGISFEVMLNDFRETERLDLAEFDGTDFGQGSDSYLVDLAEAGEPELDIFYVADLTLRNTGPDVTVADLVSSFTVTDQADASAWSIWFAEGPEGTQATMLEAGDAYAGRLVGDAYAGDHYILSFEITPDTVWVVPVDDAER